MNPSVEPSESDKLHPEQLTRALKFPTHSKRLFTIVKCDETDYRAHLLRGDRSRFTLVGKSKRAPGANVLNSLGKYLLDPKGATASKVLPFSSFLSFPSLRDGWTCEWRGLEFACLHKINQKMPVPRRAICCPKLLSKRFGEIKFFGEITVASVLCDVKSKLCSSSFLLVM